jgi:hypothetical protein
MTLAEKFHPTRFRTGDQMTAILAFLFDEEWTSPSIAEIHVTSDGFLLARNSDDCGCNDILGGVSDLKRNLNGCAEAAELTPDEKSQLLGLCVDRIQDWR